MRISNFRYVIYQSVYSFQKLLKIGNFDRQNKLAWINNLKWEQIMNKLSLLVSGLLLGGMLQLTLAMDNYQVDKSHSEISFSVRHMVLSKTKGEFDDFTVDINLDQKNIEKSSVKVVIQTSSINTDDAKRDKHLRSPDFMDVEEFPVITFDSKSIRKDGKNFIATGDFTLHGVTKEIELPFVLNGPVEAWGKDHIGVETEIVINRQDFGVSWSKTMDGGGLVVGDDVSIDISLEAVKN
jgi:polyisoprenoid-binding protein YceI